MIGESEKELLEKAIERRAELSKELSALDTLIVYYKGLLVREGLESPEGLSQPDLYRGTSKRSLQTAELAEMMNRARRIIIERGRPMKRGELVKELESEGFVITGKNKNKVFGTNLWRSGRFRSVGRDGYWPKDVALPKTEQLK